MKKKVKSIHVIKYRRKKIVHGSLQKVLTSDRFLLRFFKNNLKLEFKNYFDIKKVTLFKAK